MRAKFPELTYASPSDHRVKRWIIHTIEGLSGRKRFLPLYKAWRDFIVPRTDRAFTDMLRLIEVSLEIKARHWPPVLEPKTPLVMIANHPFGIGDGIASLALAEALNRPFKVLINNQLLRIPEIRPYSLPIDFEETREAQLLNLKTRKEALAALAVGTTIVVFPAGGVATARRPFGKAEDLPWKLFTAKLIQSAKASVLPVYFEGQNGPLFQLVSRFSLTLRLSLLVSEFRKFAGSTVKIRIGEVVPFAELRSGNDRKMMTEELHRLVHGLADPDPEAETSRIGTAGRRVGRKARGVGRLAKRKARRAGRLARHKVRRVRRRVRVRAMRKTDGAKPAPMHPSAGNRDGVRVG
ncbi:MAG: lysophospholipid acyltransferase family protein [Hyphomicrobiaceae bacterium]